MILYENLFSNNHFYISYNSITLHVNMYESYGNFYFLITPEGPAKARRVSSLKKLQNLKYPKNTTTYNEFARRALACTRGEPFHIIYNTTLVICECHESYRNLYFQITSRLLKHGQASSPRFSVHQR
jgi:hypothetical protein